IGRKQKRTRIAVQRPQNEEANAAVRNERRSKMRHEVNDEAVQPPPSADLDAEQLSLHIIQSFMLQQKTKEDPNLAEYADAAVDPPSQGVAAIDDVLVTPQDCEIEC
ncbi:hypothetical protein PIB30_107222, partial [Stylosanthes scabra]|nr:hypothetical protein [Stylosanthes scabra]